MGAYEQPVVRTGDGALELTVVGAGDEELELALVGAGDGELEVMVVGAGDAAVELALDAGDEAVGARGSRGGRRCVETGVGRELGRRSVEAGGSHWRQTER